MVSASNAHNILYQTIRPGNVLGLINAQFVRDYYQMEGVKIVHITPDQQQIQWGVNLYSVRFLRSF